MGWLLFLAARVGREGFHPGRRHPHAASVPCRHLKEGRRGEEQGERCGGAEGAEPDGRTVRGARTCLVVLPR